MEENEQENGVKNPAHKLLGKLQENRKSLHIARVPEKTKEAFMKLAEDDFCGDYGMTLKWLIDDIPSQDTRLIILAIEDFEKRLQELESKTIEEPKETEKPTKNMLDGHERVRRGLKKDE